MQCISTVTNAIQINGVQRGHIIPSEGLLCAEGLSAMLHQAVQDKRLKEILACKRGLKISHLFFANDSTIFGSATKAKGSEFIRILKVYEGSSRQQLNKQKTSLYFSWNMMGEVQNEIKTLFGAQVIKQHETYLDLPSLTSPKPILLHNSKPRWQTSWQIGKESYSRPPVKKCSLRPWPKQSQPT